MRRRRTTTQSTFNGLMLMLCVKVKELEFKFPVLLYSSIEAAVEKLSLRIDEDTSKWNLYLGPMVLDPTKKFSDYPGFTGVVSTNKNIEVS